MNILGLKGFSNIGRIDHYFTSGSFPDKWDWTLNDIPWLARYYYNDRQYQKSINDHLSCMGEPLEFPVADDYILICYSDGGLPGHIFGLLDPSCQGIIAHSATFHTKSVEEAFWLQEFRGFSFPNLPDLPTKKPILLIQNNNDKTKWLPSWYGRTNDALRFYLNYGFPLEEHSLPGNTWHGHDFDNAFGIMNAWAKRHFSFELPLK